MRQAPALMDWGALMARKACMTERSCTADCQTLWAPPLLHALTKCTRVPRRSLLTQEGICLQLQPGFHFLEVAYPYIARRLLTDEDPALRERLFQAPRLIPLCCASTLGPCCHVGQAALIAWPQHHCPGEVWLSDMHSYALHFFSSNMTARWRWQLQVHSPL
jgi:hypothetical protein